MSVRTARWHPNDKDHHAEMTVGCLVARKFTPWHVIELLDAERRDTDPEWVAQRTGVVLRSADADQWKTADDRDVHGSSPSPGCRSGAATMA
jgi:hypothetical protein